MESTIMTNTEMQKAYLQQHTVTICPKQETKHSARIGKVADYQYKTRNQKTRRVAVLCSNNYILNLSE